MSTDTSVLAQDWVHSHEEDAAHGTDAMVFRPASFPFPPSRGRWKLDLHKDKTVTEVTPGPLDRGVPRSRSWSVNTQNQLVIGANTPGEQPTVMDILDASADRLVVSRPKTRPISGS